MSKKPVDWKTAFKYSAIVSDVIIFAFIGYMVGKYYGEKGEVLGIMIGALFGTFFMWFHLFWKAGIIGKKKTK